MRFSVVGLRRHEHRLRRLRPGAMGRAHAQPGGDPAEVQSKLNGVAGVQAFVFAPPTLPGTGGGLPVQYVIRSIGGADQVYEVAEEIKNRAQKSGRFIVVQNSLSFTQPQARITIDRDRAASLGVADQRHRHNADRACRRRLGLEIRPREPQLRRHHAGRPDGAVQPGEPRQLLCAQRLRRRWCRCRRVSASKRRRRRSRSSSSTS